MTISDNAECFTANLPATVGDFVPGSGVHLGGAVGELASEDDDFGNDELGDGARVGEGRVKDGSASAGGVWEIDLGGADAEAADCEEVFGMFENVGSQFGLGADTDNVDIPVGQSCIGQSLVEFV